MWQSQIKRSRSLFNILLRMEIFHATCGHIYILCIEARIVADLKDIYILCKEARIVADLKDIYIYIYMYTMHRN